MPSSQEIRAEVKCLVRAVPFQPFVLAMENGDRIVVEQPENIAFDPVERPENRRDDFYVFSGTRRFGSTFSAVKEVVVVDLVPSN